MPALSTNLQLFHQLLECKTKIVDKTILEADEDKDGKISFQEFVKVLEHTDLDKSMVIKFS